MTTTFRNDVDLDEPRDKKLPGERFDLPCGECEAPMVLRHSAKHNSRFYGCSKFPHCQGSHGAYPNGHPRGIPANKATKKSRIKAHNIFDQLWKKSDNLKNKRMSRGGAYSWMRKAMELSHSEAHISRFDTPQCEALIQLVYRDYPDLQTRWSRLIYTTEDDLDFGAYEPEDG